MKTCKTQSSTETETVAIEQALCGQIGQLRQMACWYTQDMSAAEDLVQDTIVLALRFSNSYREGTNLKAWLGKVMRNRHISMTRRRKLEKRVYETEGKHALNEWSIGEMGRRSMNRGGGVVKDDGFSDPVSKAMLDLRPEFREAVMLCDVEGLSYAEAADKADCPIGTIMSRLHRGRRSLREQLGSRQQIEYEAA